MLSATAVERNRSQCLASCLSATKKWASIIKIKESPNNIFLNKLDKCNSQLFYNLHYKTRREE